MRRLVMSVVFWLFPLLGYAGEPAEGIALKVRRGFFTETDIGGFMTVGGGNQQSKVQTYLQLGVGYDINDKVEVGLNVGVGANSQNCWAGFSAKDNKCVEADSFTLFFLDGSVAYLFEVLPRFYLAPKLVGGYTLLDPAPVYSPPTGQDGKRKSDASPINKGLNAGGGLGIEYATSMDHFSIGVDVLYRMVLGPNIHTLQFFPRVKYTF